MGDRKVSDLVPSPGGYSIDHAPHSLKVAVFLTLIAVLKYKQASTTASWAALEPEGNQWVT